MSRLLKRIQKCNFFRCWICFKGPNSVKLLFKLASSIHPIKTPSNKVLKEMQHPIRIGLCCIRFYGLALWKRDRYVTIMTTIIRIWVTLFFYYYFLLVVNLMIVTISLVWYKSGEKMPSLLVDLFFIDIF